MKTTKAKAKHKAERPQVELELDRIAEFSACGQLGTDKVAELSADVSEFSASGQLESDRVVELSATFSEFSDAGNSKIGELDAGNLKRGTRYLPISGKRNCYFYY